MDKEPNKHTSKKLAAGETLRTTFSPDGEILEQKIVVSEEFSSEMIKQMKRDGWKPKNE